MDYDQDKVDEVTLALLWLTSFKDPVGVRAWKGQDWDTMERLHAKGFISDPKSKAKSVVLSEEGEKGQGSCLRNISHSGADVSSILAPIARTQESGECLGGSRSVAGLFEGLDFREAFD